MMKRLILFVLLYCVSCSGFAAPDKKPVMELLQQLRNANTSVNSFTVTMQLERFTPDYALQKQQVWFKRPQYIKLKQLGPFKEDAELAIKPGGSIRGHLGGFLSFAVVSLDADDENLFGVTHDSAFNTDFDKIIDIAYELTESMKDYKISEKNSANGKQIIFDTFYNASISQYRLIIDAETMMLSQLERYSGGKLMHRILWQNLKLNPPIPEKEFDL